MGIRNLMRWIQWVSSFQPVQWECLRGKRVGIDILSLLYKMRAQRQPVLETLDSLLGFLDNVGIQPICVFDGKSPQEKNGTRSARRRQRDQLSNADQQQLRISTGDRNEVKQLLYARGVLSINAEHEADTVLAYLSRHDDIAAVITSDMDFLPRGVQFIILPGDFHAPQQWRKAQLDQLLVDAKLTYERFVEMCVLMGCDYAPTIPTISYQSAYWMIREGRSMVDMLEGEGIRTTTAWEHAVKLLMGEKDRWEEIVSERQRAKWSAGPPPREPDAHILQKVQ